MQVRKNVLTLSIVAVLGMAGTAHAQAQKPAAQEAKELDKVVVAGIRGAQENRWIPSATPIRGWRW